MTRLQEMDPSYHESTQLVGKGALALRIGLLIVAIVYCVHKYVQRRWDHNVYPSFFFHVFAQSTDFTMLGERITRASTRLSTH